jgi:hypothetical protein
MPLTFPTSKLTVLVELLLADGTWTDVSQYVLWANRIVINRGRTPGQRRGRTSTCALTFRNPDKRFSPRNVTGPYFGSLKTGTPIRVSVDPGTGSVRRYTGAVPSWKPQLRGHPNDRVVPVVAVGALDRIERDTATLQSTPRRYLPGTSPLHYWPMEDAALADERGRPDSGATSLYPFVGTHPVTGAIISEPQWGKGRLGPWLSDVLSRSGSGGLTVVWAPVIMPASPTVWTIDVMFAMGTDAGANTVDKVGGAIDVNPSYLGGSANWPALRFLPYSGKIDVTMNADPAEESAVLPGIYDGNAHHLRWTASQSGANCAWEVWIDGVSVATGTTSGALTLPQVNQLGLTMDSAASGAAQGHLAIWNTAGPTLADAVAAAFGHRGESAVDRFIRLLAEEGIVGYVIEGEVSTQRMGSQRAARLSDLLHECEDVVEGVIDESVDNELQLTSPTYRWGQAVALTIDYAGGEVLPPLVPSDVVDQAYNDWTITRQDGATARYQVVDGPTSIADYPDGIGDRPTSATLALHTDDQALAHATYRANRDSVDKPRFDSLKVNFAKSPHLIEDWLALLTGNRVQVVDPPADAGTGPLDTTVEGYTESIDQADWDASLFQEPDDITGQVAEYDDTAARYDCPASSLNAPLDTTETAVKVAVNCGAADLRCRWAHDDGDYVVSTSGETMTVTAISSPAATYIAAGTAAHADNASTTPGLPAGMAKGDVMLILAAIRGTAAAPDIPTGYSRLADLGNVALFGKIHSGSESAPVVSYVGGSAGDTTSAQMAAFRSTQLSVLNAAAGPGGSSANIATPAMTIDRGRCVVIAIGWRADDWTSVTSPAGFTEIDEPDSTTGNDQGITWGYQIQTTATDAAIGTFTVTGGGAATTKSALVLLAADVQTLTVTRSTNGVVKTHAAGKQLQLATPARWAL